MFNNKLLDDNKINKNNFDDNIVSYDSGVENMLEL